MRLSSELKHLKTENEHLKRALTAKYPYHMSEMQTGAGEAMCSRSDLRSVILHNELPAMAPLSLNFDNDGESDEVKCFRTKEEDSVLEQPRCAPASQTMFSPDSLLRGTAGSLKDAVLTKTDDDGYSTMNLNNLQDGQASTLSETAQSSNRTESLAERTEVVRLDAPLADDAADQHVYKETHFDSIVGVGSLRMHNPSPVDEEATDELPSPRSLRRSFSDSDIRNLEVVEPQELSPGAPKPNKDWADPAHYFPFSKKRRSRAYLKRGDNSSSYSSDDENVRMVSRQLRKRGDLVQFRPPRKSVAVMKSNIYRRFGPNERSAMSQFEYLQEMTTDVSGLLSSPDRSPGSF